MKKLISILLAIVTIFTANVVIVAQDSVNEKNVKIGFEEDSIVNNMPQLRSSGAGYCTSCLTSVYIYPARLNENNTVTYNTQHYFSKTNGFEPQGMSTWEEVDVTNLKQYISSTYPGWYIKVNYSYLPNTKRILEVDGKSVWEWTSAKTSGTYSFYHSDIRYNNIDKLLTFVYLRTFPGPSMDPDVGLSITGLRVIVQ